jgi:acyl-CoA thioesterase
MNPIVERMYSGDLFSQWLGIERIAEGAGYCELRMTVRQEMINGFGIAHGAITYALADSALAFASNAHGKHAVSIETSINHLKPVRPGDVLRAVARETSRSHKLGIYHIEVWRDEVLVAHFKGVVYIKDQAWEV